MTEKETVAIKCAHADLKGALEAHDQLDIEVHDWIAHKQSIQDLEETFPFLKEI